MDPSDRQRLWLTTSVNHVIFFIGPRGNIEESQDVAYLTAERLLWLRSLEMKGIEGLSDFREASVYDLLYVGIARTGDSYSRLFKRGHKARLDILAREKPRFVGAVPADEIVLFMFSMDSALLTRCDDEAQNYAREDFRSKKLVIDAEKAFVNLLNPDYNLIKYKYYPEGSDGLRQSGYTAYSYTIRENLLFRTPHGSIRGGRVIDSLASVGDAQSILVIGDSVQIVDNLLEAIKSHLRQNEVE